jgi:hypothetical protein
VSAARITYVPRPDVTEEAELTAIASVYRFVLECRAKNAAGRTSASGNDAKGSQNDRALSIIPDGS